jgi:hypothetical protein
VWRTSIDTELVALDIRHCPTGATTIVAEPELACPLGFEPSNLNFVAVRAHVYVKVHSVLSNFSLRHLLEVKPRSVPFRVATSRNFSELSAAIGVHRSLGADRC